MTKDIRQSELVKERNFVTCPCCGGKGFILVFSEEYSDDQHQRVICCHCQGNKVQYKGNL